MTNSKLNTTLAAAAVALSFLAAPAAQAEVSRNTGVGQLIAAQGNAALRLIRAEAAAAIGLMKPSLPARSTRPAHPTKVAAPAVAVPAGAGASAAAGARCAE